jgi:hypothetical protein
MWSGVERRGTGDWCPMASHAAPPAVLSSGKSGGCKSVRTAAGRLTSINRSLGSCTSEGARSNGDDDGGAAAEGGGRRQRGQAKTRAAAEAEMRRASRIGKPGKPRTKAGWKLRPRNFRILLGACKVHGSASPRRASVSGCRGHAAGKVFLLWSGCRLVFVVVVVARARRVCVAACRDRSPVTQTADGRYYYCSPAAGAGWYAVRARADSTQLVPHCAWRRVWRMA